MKKIALLLLFSVLLSVGVMAFTDVECNFNEECPNGYCEVDIGNPKNNKCVFIGVQKYCGNGVCEASRGETIETCPQDCRISPPKHSPPKQVDSTLLFIILGLVLIILIMIVVIYRKSKSH